jgi:predicted N-formylglutamate amidohydrolase
VGNTATLLSPADPHPVEQLNCERAAAILLTCEHAGQLIPRLLGDLGLGAQDLRRHIAYDIGASGLSVFLSQALGAPLIAQRYSRLVIDCNRPLDAPDLIPAVSDGTAIPGNTGLTVAERQARYDEIHVPLHRAIAGQILRQKPRALIAVHSFNPTLGPEVRHMEVGLLFNRDPQLATALRHEIAKAIDIELVTLNRPYAVDDASDETIPRHGEANLLPSVLLEIRNDLIATAADQRKWADMLAPAFTRAVATLT